VRDMVRRFIDAEIKPRLEDLEHGDLPPYDILRKMVATFGLGDMARARFQRDLERIDAGDKGEKPTRRCATATIGLSWVTLAAAGMAISLMSTLKVSGLTLISPNVMDLLRLVCTQVTACDRISRGAR